MYGLEEERIIALFMEQQWSETTGEQQGLKYQDANIMQEILRATKEMGFEVMTPIQEQAIPILLEGKDIIGQAQTGTGKTAAFAIPMIQRIDPEVRRPQGIILCPTRELAIQAAEEIRKLTRYLHGVKVLPIYGGQDISRQIRALSQGVQIIVGTPGRVMDHLRRHTIKTNEIRMIVLDEADEMLNMGFVKDVTRIIEATPDERQMVLFSATTNQDVLTIAWKYQHDPIEVTVEATKQDRPQIAQYVISTEQNKKIDHLLYLLDADVYQRVMIFCNTKFMTDRLTERLKKEGYQAECIHGDVKQSQRNVVMNDFRRGKFPILIATDVAARGIDVDDVEAVINFDLPAENEYYLHRIGRTGRAHKHGVSFSLVTFQESVRMDEILKYMIAKPLPLHFEDGILRNEDGTPFFDNI